MAQSVVKEGKIPFEVQGAPQLTGIEAFAALRIEAHQNGTQDFSLEEINAEIQATRQEHDR